MEPVASVAIVSRVDGATTPDMMLVMRLSRRLHNIGVRVSPLYSRAPATLASAPMTGTTTKRTKTIKKPSGGVLEVRAV